MVARVEEKFVERGERTGETSSMPPFWCALLVGTDGNVQGVWGNREHTEVLSWLTGDCHFLSDGPLAVVVSGFVIGVVDVVWDAGFG